MSSWSLWGDPLSPRLPPQFWDMQESGTPHSQDSAPPRAPLKQELPISPSLLHFPRVSTRAPSPPARFVRISSLVVAQIFFATAKNVLKYSR